MNVIISHFKRKNLSEMTRIVEFGVKKSFSLPTSASRINYIGKINKYRYIVTSNKSIAVYEDENQIYSFPIPTQTAIYIPKFDALVFIPKKGNKFLVHFVRDLKECVYEGPEIDHLGINHLLFSEKSDTLISFGIGVRTWRMKCPLAENRRLNQKIVIEITERARFLEDSIMKELFIPTFDSNNERILFHTRNTLIGYDLDGNEVDLPITYKTENFVMFRYNSYDDSYVTIDLEQGMCLWSKLGSIINRFPFNAKKVITMYFINFEFALAIDSEYKLDIIDLRTMQTFPGVILEEKPLRFFFVPGEFPTFVSVATKMNFYTISTFWQQWIELSTTVVRMLRCPSAEKSARLLFLLCNSSFALLSPKSGNKVGVCLSESTSFPKDFFVQRSDRTTSRDLLRCIQEDGTFEIFQMNEIPFSCVSSMKMNATSLCQAIVNNRYVNIIGTTFGSIVVIDDSTLEIVSKISPNTLPPLKLFAHHSSDSLIVVYQRDIVVFSLSNLSEKYKVNQPYVKVREVFWDYLINGYEDGRVEIFSIHKDHLYPVFDEQYPIHDGAVSCLARGSTFFLSAAANGSVIIWSQTLEMLAKLKFPLGIYSACVLNGTRSILFGLEKAVMILDGSQVFAEVDEEDIIWDNFDRRIDDFELNRFQFEPRPPSVSDSVFMENFRKEKGLPPKFSGTNTVAIAPMGLTNFVKRRRRRGPALNINCLSVTAFEPDPTSLAVNAENTDANKKDENLTEQDKNLLLQDMLSIDKSQQQQGGNSTMKKPEPAKEKEKEDEYEYEYIEEYEEEIYERPPPLKIEIPETDNKKPEEEEIEVEDYDGPLFSDDDSDMDAVRSPRRRKKVEYNVPKLIPEDQKSEKSQQSQSSSRKSRSKASQKSSLSRGMYYDEYSDEDDEEYSEGSKSPKSKNKKSKNASKSGNKKGRKDSKTSAGYNLSSDDEENNDENSEKKKAKVNKRRPSIIMNDESSENNAKKKGKKRRNNANDYGDDDNDDEFDENGNKSKSKQKAGKSKARKSSSTAGNDSANESENEETENTETDENILKNNQKINENELINENEDDSNNTKEIDTNIKNEKEKDAYNKNETNKDAIDIKENRDKSINKNDKDNEDSKKDSSSKSKNGEENENKEKENKTDKKANKNKGSKAEKGIKKGKDSTNKTRNVSKDGEENSHEVKEPASSKKSGAADIRKNRKSIDGASSISEQNKENKDKEAKSSEVKKENVNLQNEKTKENQDSQKEKQKKIEESINKNQDQATKSSNNKDNSPDLANKDENDKTNNQDDLTKDANQQNSSAKESEIKQNEINNAKLQKESEANNKESIEENIQNDAESNENEMKQKMQTNTNPVQDKSKNDTVHRTTPNSDNNENDNKNSSENLLRNHAENETDANHEKENHQKMLENMLAGKSNLPKLNSIKARVDARKSNYAVSNLIAEQSKSKPFIQQEPAPYVPPKVSYVMLGLEGFSPSAKTARESLPNNIANPNLPKLNLQQHEYTSGALSPPARRPPNLINNSIRHKIISPRPIRPPSFRQNVQQRRLKPV